MMRSVIACVGLAASSCLAQVTPVGPFVGDAQEGFEALPSGFVCQYTLFGGGGDMTEIAGGCGLHNTSGWGFGCSIFPHGGGRLFGSAGAAVQIKFNPPICAIGGWWGTNVPPEFSTGDGKIAFYDINGNHIHSDAIVSPPNCTWTWNGWESTTPIGRVEIYGGNVFGGGFQMIDDMEITVTCSAACYADCEGDGDLDVFDFLCFQSEWAAQTAYGDCEQDGDWDVFDFLCFQSAYANGCN